MKPIRLDQAMYNLNKILLDMYKSALKDGDAVMIAKLEKNILEAMR